MDPRVVGHVVVCFTILYQFIRYLPPSCCSIGHLLLNVQRKNVEKISALKIPVVMQLRNASSCSYIVLLYTKDGGGENEWPQTERVRILWRIMKEMSSRDPNPPGIKCIHQILFFSFYATFIAVLRQFTKTMKLTLPFVFQTRNTLLNIGLFKLTKSATRFIAKYKKRQFQSCIF